MGRRSGLYFVGEATVDTKIINAYNERNQKLVGSGLVIVDAATEPLRVLKVLVEGLPDGRSGLWLTNFKGIPVARTLSPFDLIYLDQNYYVVHCVQISVEGEYEPFRGDPASALVVPPKSIASSKMQPGDRLMFRTAEAPAAQQAAREPRISRPPAAPQAPSNQPAGAHFFNSAFPVPPVDSVGGPLPAFLAGSPGSAGLPPAASASAEQDPTSQAANPAVSGRLTKSAKSLLGQAPSFRPSGEPASSTPGSSGGAAALSYASAPTVDVAFSVKAPTRLMSTPALSPAEHIHDSRPSNQVHSGRLMRGVNLAPAILPDEEPEVVPATVPAEAETAADLSPLPAEALPADEAASPVVEAPSAKPRESTHGIVIPITSAPGLAAARHVSEAVPEIEEETPAAATVNPFAAEPAASAALVPVERKPSVRKAEPKVSPALPREAPPVVVPEVAPAAQTAQPAAQPAASIAAAAAQPEAPGFPRTQIAKAPAQSALVQAKKKPSWDVRLLYSLFPEFNPSRPPEIRIPRLDEKRETEFEDEENLSTKLRVLCWLYPDLHLDKFKQKQSEQRRAVRIPMPGLVAYFFTGGAPRPHPIKDISVTGFYMCTNERWLPGTIIRVTLQMVEPRDDGGRDSITVHSRVVRWGPDGGGFEFVLPGFLE